MPVLDAKREKFAQEYLINVANGMARGRAAAAAAKLAGYKGSSLAANARRLPQHSAIKARLAELVAPVQAQSEQNVMATIESASLRLSRIIHADVDLANIKATDVVGAARQMALMHGWMAPELVKHENPPAYVISERPMTEEEWIRERATVIDVTPEQKEENR